MNIKEEQVEVHLVGGYTIRFSAGFVDATDSTWFVFYNDRQASHEVARYRQEHVVSYIFSHAEHRAS